MDIEDIQLKLWILILIVVPNENLSTGFCSQIRKKFLRNSS